MEHKRVKMIVTDLDDTLLTPDKEIAPEAVSLIGGLAEQGIRFTFITGRPPYAVARFAKKVKITAPIVSCNGAVLYDHESGRVLKDNSLQTGGLETLLREADRKGLTVFVYAGETEYALSETEWTRIRKAAGREVPVTSLDSIIEGGAPVYKVNIMSGTKTDVFETLTEQILDVAKEYSVALYGNSGCEIVAKDVNKKKGLYDLCEVCGILPEEVLAVGDNANDQEMLQAAGIGAAVANGTEETKQYADYICEASYTAGVMEAIAKFAERRTS